MAKDVVVFETANLPAHLASMFGTAAASDLSANVGSGGFPFLSLKGKVWTIVRGKDDRTVVTNSDGDPRSSIEVVVIKANPHLSKVYYAKGYEEGSDAKPDCYSSDGIAPAADCEAPQAKKCAVCPHNQWGSKVTEQGGKGKACSDSRRIAVAPVGQINDPMLVRVPAASLRPLAEYGSALAKKGIPYQAVITKIGFDPEAASPKLTFKFVGFLNQEQAQQVKSVMDSDIVTQIIGGNGNGAAVENDAAPALPAPTVQAKSKPAAKASVTADDIKVPAPKAAPATKAASAFGGGGDTKTVKVETPKVADDLEAALDSVLGSEDDE